MTQENTHFRVLVLCTGNSCRSQMAEGLLNTRFAGKIAAYSAGSAPSGYVHPGAVRAMAELGIDIGGGRSKHLDEFTSQPFDVVLTVCDSAAEACPVFPGRAQRIHRSFDDPADAQGTPAEVHAVFCRVRDEISAWLDALFGAQAGWPKG